MKKATIIVEGWIQVAGYGTFVKQVALNLGIKGLVRNLSNGKVEIFCEADSSKIEVFEQKITYRGKKNDPLSLYVENLAVHVEGEKGYLGPWKKYSGFEIDYGFEIQSPVDRAMLENLESGKIFVVSSNDKISALTDQFSMFRQETNGNFEKMEEKYGSISEEMKKINITLEKLADAYVKRQS
jgi:acylphosphatase